MQNNGLLTNNDVQGLLSSDKPYPWMRECALPVFVMLVAIFQIHSGYTSAKLNANSSLEIWDVIFPRFHHSELYPGGMLSGMMTVRTGLLLLFMSVLALLNQFTVYKNRLFHQRVVATLRHFNALPPQED